MPLFSEDPSIDSWLKRHLACPRDLKPLDMSPGFLRCEENHTYPVVQGVPVLLLSDAVPTQKEFWEILEQPGGSPRLAASSKEGIDPFVRRALPATSGSLYGSLAAKLQRYPIPELPLPDGNKNIFLDLGCNWGRWCLSASRKGYLAIGIDPNLEAVLAARRVSEQLKIPCCFLVADARRLPFSSKCTDVVFSYSVLQHFDKSDACRALRETSRVLKEGGTALVEMPNAFGLHNLAHQIKRGFRKARDFEVRYWTPAELHRTFTSCVGPSRLVADGYFCLNPQLSDISMLPFAYRLVVRVSEWLRKRSLMFPWLIHVADSLYVQSKALLKS